MISACNKEEGKKIFTFRIREIFNIYEKFLYFSGGRNPSSRSTIEMFKGAVKSDGTDT